MENRDIHLRLIANLLSEINASSNMKSKSYSERYFYAAKKHLVCLFGTFKCYDLQTFSKVREEGWDSGEIYQTEHQHILRRYELNGCAFHLPMKIYAFLGYSDSWKKSPLFDEYKPICLGKIKGIKEGGEMNKKDIRRKYAYLFELICVFCKNELCEPNLANDRKLQINNLYQIALWVCNCMEKDKDKRLIDGDRFDFYWYDYENERRLIEIDSDVYWHIDVVNRYLGQPTNVMDKLRNTLLSILNENGFTEMGTGTFSIAERQRYDSFHSLHSNGYYIDFVFHCEVTGGKIPFAYSLTSQDINTNIYGDLLKDLRLYYTCAAEFIKVSKSQIKEFWSDGDDKKESMKELANPHLELSAKKGIIGD